MNKNTAKQLRLPFEPPKEQARRRRVERLLYGELRKHIKRASELKFNYRTATKIVRRWEESSLHKDRNG